MENFEEYATFKDANLALFLNLDLTLSCYKYSFTSYRNQHQSDTYDFPYRKHFFSDIVHHVPY